MESIYLKWWGCGGFEILLGDVNIAVDPYLFGADLDNAEPIYDYIFISHEHFDHCHPKTLRKLCQGERFKKLFVSIGCLVYGQNHPLYEELLPVDKHVPREKVQEVYPKYLADEERSFPGPFELDLGPIQVEAFESGESASPDLPTCGYLITHKEKEVSFFHTGDPRAPYPGLANLRGRVDFLIHMKLGLGSAPGHSRPRNFEVLSQFLDYIEPRFLIPIHYRTDRKSDPIPDRHWPPNIDDPFAFIEDLREGIGDRTRILPFTAGVQYEVEMPSKKVKWEWQWFNSWDDDAPGWLTESMVE